MRVKIDYTDGRYTMYQTNNTDGTLIEESVWNAYCRHLEQDQVFQSLLHHMDEASLYVDCKMGDEAIFYSPGHPRNLTVCKVVNSKLDSIWVEFDDGGERRHECVRHNELAKLPNP